MTDLEKYCTEIIDEKIVACDKMKRICDRLLFNLYNPDEFHFDEDIANRHINFIERFCKVPAGNLGADLKLELFQKAILQATFGFVDDDDLRQYREVFIVIGRKNGKTTLTSAVELDLLINDREGAPEIYNVANAKDQAKKGYTACINMRKQSPLLTKHIKKRAADLYCERNLGFIKALAANTNTLDGLDIHGATMDEMAAWKSRAIYDLVIQATTARKQPLIFGITTNGFIRNSIFDTQYEYSKQILNGDVINDRFLPFIYELDDPKEWTDEEKWIKANPGLDTIKSRDQLRGFVQKALDDPSFKPTVLVKDFNIAQTSSASWLRWEDLNNEELIPDDIPFRYGIGGFDAADSVDLNAAKIICQRRLPDGTIDPHLYIRQMYWCPQHVIDEFEGQGKRQGRDNAPYALWKEQGLLRTVETAKVDKKVILDWFQEIQEQDDIYIQYIGYDPWHIDDSLLREFKQMFGEQSMIQVRQGVATLSQPMKDLQSDLKANLIIYNNNPIDKWCLANTAIKTDINGNIQPIKTPDHRNRIDGTLALLDAYVIWKSKRDEYQSVL